MGNADNSSPFCKWLTKSLLGIAHIKATVALLYPWLCASFVMYKYGLIHLVDVVTYCPMLTR